MAIFFGKEDELKQVPTRIKVAMKYLEHTRWLTEQEDSSIPARKLTPLESSVEQAALKAVQAYLLGEMDFNDVPNSAEHRRDEEDDPGVQELQPS